MTLPRRLMLLLVAAFMVVVMAVVAAGPATAAAREPTLDGPGNPQTPEENPAQPTDTAGENCYGQGQSNFVKGSGGAPGSLAEPVEVVPGVPNYYGHRVSSLDPGQISETQQEAREEAAGQSC